jgi:hypothetical protein
MFGGITLSNLTLSNVSLGYIGRIISSDYIRNSVNPFQFDISRGNISNSNTTSSRNFIGTDATASNNIGGVTLSNNVVIASGAFRNAATGFTIDISQGNTSNSGTIVASGGFRNAVTGFTIDISQGNTSNSGTIVASGGFRNAVTGFTIDISQGNITNTGTIRTGAGTAAAPSHTFGTDVSTGMYLPAAGQLGFTVSGISNMLVDNSSIFIGRPANTTQTALLDLGGGFNSDGTATGRSFPAMAFNYGDGTTGGFRHFIRTRHQVGVGNVSNAIDFFTNDSTSNTGSSFPGTGNVLPMSVTSAGIVINARSLADASSSGLILSNTTTGLVSTGNGNTWNQSLYFTGNQRAWGVGVETSAGSGFALGFFNYTATAAGTVTGARFIRGYISGANVGASTPMNFTGQHRCFIKNTAYADISGIVGLIVSANNNETMSMSGGLKRGKDAITVSESLPIVSLTSNAYDKRVFGIIASGEDPEKREDAYGNFVTPYEKEPGDTRAYVNSVGEGAIWVANVGGNIESGDYVCSSSLPGYAQKQSDDLLHNYSVAKITMDCDFTAPLQPKYTILKDASGNNVLDAKGNICWTQEIDASGNPVYETAYSIRYIDGSGITLDTSENAYIAAFLPCTYHCG